MKPLFQPLGLDFSACYVLSGVARCAPFFSLWTFFFVSLFTLFKLLRIRMGYSQPAPVCSQHEVIFTKSVASRHLNSSGDEYMNVETACAKNCLESALFLAH